MWPIRSKFCIRNSRKPSYFEHRLGIVSDFEESQAESCLVLAVHRQEIVERNFSFGRFEKGLNVVYGVFQRFDLKGKERIRKPIQESYNLQKMHLSGQPVIVDKEQREDQIRNDDHRRKKKPDA